MSVLLALAAASAPVAQAQEDAPEPAGLPLAMLGESPRSFGAPDSVWGAAGLGYADDLSESVDSYLWATYSWFMVQDVELALEGGLWNHDQPGDDAASLSLSTIVRWHFVNAGGWTVFADAGIGVLVSTDVVPEGGTGLNFLPRLGAGVTRDLGGRARLLAGVRWHHISNARIHGDIRNPSRDAAMLYVGVIFPF
ncbi:MAG: acyloxyacyl hydrolase [Phycisphaerales bacterium JB039]